MTYGFHSSDTAEHENGANLGVLSELVPSAVQIKDYISLDDNTLIISDMTNCNEDDLSEEDTADQHDEECESDIQSDV